MRGLKLNLFSSLGGHVELSYGNSFNKPAADLCRGKAGDAENGLRSKAALRQRILYVTVFQPVLRCELEQIPRLNPELREENGLFLRVARNSSGSHLPTTLPLASRKTSWSERRLLK
jgi:hypothetical protein